MSVQIRNSNKETITMKNSDELNIIPEGTGNDELDRAIEMAGYAYDPKQDIFYSTLDPWQRDIG